MNLLRQITGAVARIARDVANAPRVTRELRERRAEPARTPAPLSADDINGQVPEAADIETAAHVYERARTDTNAAARLKRSAEKILRRTPDGSYGAVTVERFESSREVADLDAIKALLDQHGLGDIPMKRCAPSLTITWVQEQAPAGDCEHQLVLTAA
jgi:hypothetical protein